MLLALHARSSIGGEVARKRKPTIEESRALLFERLREARPQIVATTVRDTDIPAEYVEPAFEQVIDLVEQPLPTSEQLASWRDEGERLARAGAPTERVLDGYLSLNWALWEEVMRQEEIPREVILEFGDRLLRGLDDAIAAISQGYVRVEIEAAAAHSERRRAVLEQSIDRVEVRIRAPVTHHRTKPGIRLPVVLDWRARVLVFARADWAGDKRLREALPAVLGPDIVVIDTGPVHGIEPLSDALEQAEYSASVAEALGRRGWIGDPDELALETTFLLDRKLVDSAVRRELGPLLSDPRMGEELLETLEVYLGSRQNTREAARRLHLAPRTVAYRLERIETLLGEELDGDVAMRLGAAILALRVSRQAAQVEVEQ
jgi:hypothetical protein